MTQKLYGRCYVSPSDGLLPGHKLLSQCHICRMDIAAYALNHLPSKYVVTRKGEVYSKLAELQIRLRQMSPLL